MTSLKLEIISDIDMYCSLKKVWEEVFLGGIPSKVNSKYMKSYDDKKPSKYVTYLDANNLYGQVMRQYLPYAGIRLLILEEINKFNVNFIHRDSPDGYILEVDLEYYTIYIMIMFKLLKNLRLIVICYENVITVNLQMNITFKLVMLKNVFKI